jgi:spore maturation protein CgeB
MRLLKIAKRPQRYWATVYAQNPGLDTSVETVQRAAFCSDFYGPVDSWEYWLRRTGVDAHDVFLGITPMDTAWWRENGSGAQPAAFDLVIERIRRLAPDVLVLEGLEGFSKTEVARLRTASPTIKVVAGLTGIELLHNPVIGTVDVILSCMKGQVATLKNAGKQAVVLAHAFDPRILQALGVSDGPAETINFVGNVVSGSHMHDERRRALEALIVKAGLVIYTDVEALTSIDVLRQARLSGAYWTARAALALGAPKSLIDSIGPLRYASSWPARPAWGASREILSAAHPSAFGLGMYRLLRRARATFNLHVAFAGPYAANMRLFEATGAGLCLLTDEKSDLAQYFTPNVEVLTYSSVDEAVKKARWIGDHPVEADAIAARGQARTLRDHTFAQRMPIVKQALELALAGRKP